MMNHDQITNFVCNIADLIRDYYKRSKYPDVILPFTVLRRLDCPHTLAGSRVGGRRPPSEPNRTLSR